MDFLQRPSCITKKLENSCQNLSRVMEKIHQYVAGKCCSKIFCLPLLVIPLTHLQHAVVVTFVLHYVIVQVVLKTNHMSWLWYNSTMSLLWYYMLQIIYTMYMITDTYLYYTTSLLTI